MATIVVLRHKHMKLFKPFTPHVIAWSVRKGFNQSIRKTKEQKTRLQCLASAMPKPVMPSGHQEQTRRQDLAAAGAKNQKGGHILKILHWMYAATKGPNVKWAGTHFKWGGRAPLAPRWRRP